MTSLFGFFNVAVAVWHSHPPWKRRHIVCGAARQCGVRLQPVRWGDTGTERSSLGAEIAHSAPEGPDRAQRSPCRKRQKEFYTQRSISDTSKTEDLLSSAHLWFFFLHNTLLPGTRHAASLSARWTGVGLITWWVNLIVFCMVHRRLL